MPKTREKPRKKRGRPPLGPGESEAREKILMVRLSLDEYSRLRVAAGGVPLATWLRDAALAAAR